MDRSWISLRVGEPRYVSGIVEFINFVRNNGVAERITNDGEKRYLCPCKDCMNSRSSFHNLETIAGHLFTKGMMGTYTVWDNHGEASQMPIGDEWYEAVVHGVALPQRFWVSSSSTNNPTELDSMGNILHDRFPYHEQEYASSPAYGNFNVADMDIQADVDNYNVLLAEAQRPLYPGSRVTLLETVIDAMNMKVNSKMSDATFNRVCQHIQTLLPPDSCYPVDFGKVKKILASIGLGYNKIDACRYHCVLYYRELEHLPRCPVCNTTRYKKSHKHSSGRRSAYHIYHFPLTPRLQRLFMSQHTGKHMRWHGERNLDESALKHPADGEAWQSFDRSFPDFAADSRNVRLGLATDGFNPFGAKSLSHSTWPVVVMPYNLPPNMIMKKEFNIMTLLIPGKSSPSKCLDVMLRPVIDELKVLWEDGVTTFDRHIGRTFQMRAVVMWTISDFPGLGMLSMATSGYKACPICLDDVDAKYIGKRMTYRGHRRWLQADHAWRCDTAGLFGSVEFGERPRRRSGLDLLHDIECDEYQYRSNHPLLKKRITVGEKKCWYGKSIFWELPYWSSLEVRHCLDVMHIEKNVSDKILGFLLDLDGKHAKNKDEHKNPPYRIKSQFKTKIFEFFSTVQYPHGLAGNISRNVKIQDNKMYGLKSHDHHVLFQRLLPVAIRPYLADRISEPLIAFSRFFQKLCARELKIEDVRGLQEDIIFILCKLETIFPPSFFVMMTHLCVHLPEQVLLTGPVHCTWMYPIERQLGSYKDLVHSMSNPEANLAQAYLASESMTYCSLYLSSPEATSENQTEETWRLSVVSDAVRLRGQQEGRQLTSVELEQAHWHVLQNCSEVQIYMFEHKAELLRSTDRGINLNNVDAFQRREFSKYFKDKMDKVFMRDYMDNGVSRELINLGSRPQYHRIWNTCFVNGIKFHTEERDKNLMTQNCGVMLEAGDDDFYYGVIEQVVELVYLFGTPVVLFKCKWYDNSVDRRRPPKTNIDNQILSINASNIWQQDDAFVLATLSQQVFYLQDLKRPGWKVVNKMFHRNIYAPETIMVPDASGTRARDSVVCNTQPDQAYQEVNANLVPGTSTIRDYNIVSFHDMQRVMQRGQSSRQHRNIDNDEDSDGENAYIDTESESDAEDVPLGSSSSEGIYDDEEDLDYNGGC